MALTVRTNGVGAGLINSNWWNDYYNLLTGTMADQPLLVNNGLTLKQVAYTTPSAPTLALHAGTGPGIGAYTYAVGYAMGNGQTVPGTTATITTTTGNQQVTLTTIPTGPTGTTARILYRSKVGTSSPLYILHTISDNTTATYLDSASDTSLTVLALLHDAFGGSLQILNQAGTLNTQLYNDGTIGMSGGQSILFSAYNPVNGETPNALWMGSVNGGGAGGTADLVVYNNSGGYITLNSTASRVSLRNQFGSAWLDFIWGSNNIPYLQCTAIGDAIGFKNHTGVKLAEIKSNGNFIISGTQYQTASGSVSTASGQSFDSFDVAEVYPTDQNYPGGTIVCPGPNGLLIQCTHDNCFCAMVVSQNPGLLLGTPDVNQLSIALAGRVNVKTAFDILTRTMVVSDGRGGVRAAAHGESAFVLGFTLNETSGAQVGIILKSYFGVVL